MTIHWIEEFGLKTITGRSFQDENVFHKVVWRVQFEISSLLLRKTEAKKILKDPDDIGLTDFPPHLAEQVNVYIYEPGPLSDSLRERLADAMSAVIAFWRDHGRLWSNESFFKSVEETECIDDDTCWLCVVAACLLCLDRALVHGDRGHVLDAENWLDCAQWLRFSLAAEEVISMRAMLGILAGFQRREADERSQRARKLNEQRHTKTREARQKVENDWESNPSRFRSAAKAGVHYSDWLAKQGYQFEPRTVTGWICAHAKATGKKLR